MACMVLVGETCRKEINWKTKEWVDGEHMVWIDLAESRGMVQCSWCSDEGNVFKLFFLWPSLRKEF